MGYMENETRQGQLRDIRDISRRDMTCVLTTRTNVGNTVVRLAPPDGCVAALVQIVTDGGAASSSKCLFISESRANPASATLGSTLGVYDMYEVKGNNNVNSFTMIATSAVTHVVSVMYYVYNQG